LLVVYLLFNIVEINKDTQSVNRKDCSKSLIKLKNDICFANNFLDLYILNCCSIFSNSFFKNLFQLLNKIYKNIFLQLIKRVYYYNSIYINIRKISSEILNIVYIVLVSLINYILILFIYLHFCVLICPSFLYLYNILSTVRQYCTN